MSKKYSSEEIDELIKDVQEQFMSPLFKAAQEELLAKAEAKKVESPKEGGNGTEPVKMAMKSDGSAPRSDAMIKEESPMAKEADDENPMADKSKDASPSVSDSPAAKESSAAPADASSEAPDAGAEMADPAAQDDGMDQSAQLAEAYNSLSDEDLKAHYEAIKGAIMGRMNQGAEGSVPSTPPVTAPEASAPPAMPPAPAQKAAPQMGAPMMPAMKSESTEDNLIKSEVKDLQAQVAGLTAVLEKMLVPTRKSVTSMTQYLSKSEEPVKKLNSSEVKAKLARLAATPDLAKSDRDVINRYFLAGEQSVKLEEIEHLLK